MYFVFSFSSLFAKITERDNKYLCLCKSTDCGDFQYIIKKLIKKKRIKSLKLSYSDILCKDSNKLLIPHTISKGFTFDIAWMIKQGVPLNQLKGKQTFLDILKNNIIKKVKSPDEDNPHHWRDSFNLLRNTSKNNFAKFACEINETCICPQILKNYGKECELK